MFSKTKKKTRDMYKIIYVKPGKMYMNVLDICIFYIKTIFKNRRPATVVYW
jgi:hypothetical protein